MTGYYCFRQTVFYWHLHLKLLTSNILVCAPELTSEQREKERVRPVVTPQLAVAFVALCSICEHQYKDISLTRGGVKYSARVSSI